MRYSQFELLSNKETPWCYTNVDIATKWISYGSIPSLSYKEHLVTIGSILKSKMAATHFC